MNRIVGLVDLGKEVDGGGWGSTENEVMDSGGYSLF